MPFTDFLCQEQHLRIYSVEFKQKCPIANRISLASTKIQATKDNSKWQLGTAKTWVAILRHVHIPISKHNMRQNVNYILYLFATRNHKQLKGSEHKDAPATTSISYSTLHIQKVDSYCLALRSEEQRTIAMGWNLQADPHHLGLCIRARGPGGGRGRGEEPRKKSSCGKMPSSGAIDETTYFPLVTTRGLSHLCF